MKLSYSFATIAVSLLSTTEGLQDKNLRSAVSSISKAASSSSTADVQKHASIRHTIRSAATTASTSPKDIQRHAQAVNDGYYYPSWSSGDETCKNDGNAPDYMITDGGYHESVSLYCVCKYTCFVHKMCTKVHLFQFLFTSLYCISYLYCISDSLGLLLPILSL